MPIHDFECPKCGHFEPDVLDRGELEPLYCEECQAPMERVLATFGFVFEGGL